MDLGQRLAAVRQPWQRNHALLAIPVVLIVVIMVVDILAPSDVHLGPLLVIAPALTASFAGPRTTALIGVLAIAAQAYIGLHFGALFSRTVVVQLIALAVLSCLIVVFCAVRERKGRELAQVRSVSEAAQHVLLWPLPDRIGPLQTACLYLAAEDEAQIGGDLYAATRTENGARVIIGDVRGKGLAAVGEAALLLGAFRESAHQQTTLPALAAALERSARRYLPDFAPQDEAGESFVTALLLDIPDQGHLARMTSCGHPAPLLLGPGHTVTLPDLHPAPPLGVGAGGATPDDYTLDEVPFEPGSTLLLYTDGVIEARDRAGGFYPFARRAAQWTDSTPEVLLHHIRRDLLAHVGGRLGDDAALIALHRAPTR
ncbi:PP2C family protein-serine/threonine phosphatase [Streptomyces laculatispora]|uniref:PP2C family protein-serine/threonine phosphatase n=1 Tax=Streptomyces laculatispora TaxID=887464 RepID=UPI001A940685|nr:PP2C family protein-serine/threonine phosphatase [Streptomyces laculatispora]MBO0914942.1 serine/threonine-protein phosphatase [Streptomyces laculatispora]